MLSEPSSGDRGGGGKVRRLGRSSCRVLAMATSSGSASSVRRNKRPWRQPRHAPGYHTTPSSTSAADGAGTASEPPADREDDATGARKSPGETERSLKEPEKDDIDEGKGSDAQVETEGGSVVEIDGSVMEGVGHCSIHRRLWHVFMYQPLTPSLPLDREDRYCAMP